MDLNKSIQAGVGKDLKSAKEFLKKVVNKELSHLIADYQNNPTEFLDDLRQSIIPILGVLEQFGEGIERDIRTKAYDDMAQLMAKKFALDRVAIRAWIIREVEEGYPVTPEEQALASKAHEILSRAHIALRCKYTKVGVGKYNRIAQVYLKHADASGKVDRLESECAITMDELPSEVSEAFNIHGKTEFSFSII